MGETWSNWLIPWQLVKTVEAVVFVNRVPSKQLRPRINILLSSSKGKHPGPRKGHDILPHSLIFTIYRNSSTSKQTLTKTWGGCWTSRQEYRNELLGMPTCGGGVNKVVKIAQNARNVPCLITVRNITPPLWLIAAWHELQTKLEMKLRSLGEFQVHAIGSYGRTDFYTLLSAQREQFSCSLIVNESSGRKTVNHRVECKSERVFWLRLRLL